MSIVVFASFEEAMVNSHNPQTSEWAAHAVAHDGPPIIRNLDAIMTEVRTDIEQRQKATS